MTTPDVSQADVEELCKQLRNAHDLIETLSLANVALRKERDDATFEMQERATTLAGHLDAMADLVAEIAALRERAEKAESEALQWQRMLRQAQDLAIEREKFYERGAYCLMEMMKAYEREAYCLTEMMKAYERRIRTDCTNQEQIDKRPWECAEYRAGADFLRATWPIDAALAAQGGEEP